MESTDDALTYPMEDDDWTVTVLIGGGLSLLSFLIVPAILVYGYLVQAIRKRADGATQPPGFEDWGELLVDGVKAWLTVSCRCSLRSSCSEYLSAEPDRARGGTYMPKGGALAGIGATAGSFVLSWSSATLRQRLQSTSPVRRAAPGDYGDATDVRQPGSDAPVAGLVAQFTPSTSWVSTFWVSASFLPRVAHSGCATGDAGAHRPDARRSRLQRRTRGRDESKRRNADGLRKYSPAGRR